MKKFLALALLVATSGVFAADCNKCVLNTYVSAPAKALLEDTIDLTGKHVTFAKDHYLFSAATLSGLAFLAWKNKELITAAITALLTKKAASSE